jgi:hypothetical protein
LCIFVRFELLLFISGINPFTLCLSEHLHTLVCTQAGRHWSWYNNSYTQFFDTAFSPPLQRTAQWRGPPVDSITPNITGQTSSICIISVVFKLHSAELWGSTADFQGFRQWISFITKWANTIFVILNYSFYCLTLLFS